MRPDWARSLRDGVSYCVRDVMECPSAVIHVNATLAADVEEKPHVKVPEWVRCMRKSREFPQT
jgi:hypothetical protein